MATREIQLNKTEEQIIIGFLSKMRSENMTFHEVMDWWRKTGQVYLFQINNQLRAEEKKENEV